MSKSLSFKSITDLMLGVRHLGSIDGKHKVSKAILSSVKYNARAKQIRHTYTFKPQKDNEPSTQYKNIYGKSYRTVLLFGKIEAQDFKDTNHPHKVDKTFTAKPQPNTSPVKVSCTCKRFQHAWSWADRKRKVLPPEFTLIPYDNYQGVMNPDQIQGACKHIIAAIRSSRRRRLLK